MRIRLSTLEASVEALLRVNNVRVRYLDETDEEIRRASEREWTDKDEVVLSQWREFQRVFEDIRHSKNMFSPIPEGAVLFRNSTCPGCGVVVGPFARPDARLVGGCQSWGILI